MLNVCSVPRPCFSLQAVWAALRDFGCEAQACVHSVSGAVAEAELEAVHERWQAGLRAARVRTSRAAYMAVWLEAGIEREVDEAWTSSPLQGTYLHALAASLCMQAAAELVPELAVHACAPVPDFDPELADALSRAGLPTAEHRAPLAASAPCLQPHSSLLAARRYAVISYASWRGGCHVCAMRFSSDPCARFSASGADSCAQARQTPPGV